MIRADLHIHSQYSSDGEFRPADIVGKCAAGGVDLFALTDHNTVRGLDEACDGALQAGLESVPGIEIDCSFEGTDLHLLGYGIDWKSPDFRALEETVAAKVMASFGETVGKLRRLGFAVDEQAVLAAAAGKLPTLELIAEVMLSDPACDTPLLAPYRKGGARGDMPYINFYLDFGAQGRPAFVPVEYMNFRDAVELVRDNGACRWSRIPDSTCGAGSVSSRSCWSAGPRDWKFSIITTMIGRSPISRRWSGAVGP